MEREKKYGDRLKKKLTGKTRGKVGGDHTWKPYMDHIGREVV